MASSASARCPATPFLLELAAENGVAITFCRDNGRFMARMQGPISGNVLLRRRQYQASDDRVVSSSIARAIVIAKISNCRVVLLRAARERTNGDAVKALEFAGMRLGRIQDGVAGADDLDLIRGHEGDAAETYFSVFDHLAVAAKNSFFFERRSRRPPLDNLNALLSFLYTLLAHDIASALESVGLDAKVGFLHRDRPGRPSLALDLMEELRPVLADRLALSMVNRRQITGAGFSRSASGAVLMDDATRKEVLIQWQERKRDEITHPFLGERIAMGLVPHVQALLLARYLRGDLDGYPPYFWR